MIPGMNMNSRQMRQAMKKMGVEQEEIQAEEVIIRLKDKDLVFSQPEVSAVDMMGQQTFQVVGEFHEEQRDTTVEIQEEDIQTVMEQTQASRETAKEAIVQANGDLAQAILSLQETGDTAE